MIERSVRYDIKGRKYIDLPYKYYFEDLGLRNVRVGFRQTELQVPTCDGGIHISYGDGGYNQRNKESKKRCFRDRGRMVFGIPLRYAHVCVEVS